MIDKIRNHYYHFLEEMGDALIITNKDHVVMYMNKMALEVSGYPDKMLVGKKLFDFLRMVDNKGQSICREILEPVVKEGKTMGLKEGTRLCFHNGKCIYASASIAPWEHEGEGGLIWTFRDITRVVNRSMELQDQFDQLKVFKTIFDETQTVILLVDLQGRFIKVNKAAERCYGYSGEEFKGLTLKDIRRDSKVMEEIRDPDLVDKKKISSVHYNKKGEAFPVEIFSRYINLQGENYLLGMIRDVSSEVEAKRRLSREKKRAELANQAKSEFLSNMSHEVRTPISGIMGMTELLLRDDLNQDQVENLKIIKTASENLLNILNDVLDYSKIESGHLTLNRSPFSLQEFMNNVDKNYSRMMKEKGVLFEVTNFPAMKKELYGDVNRLYQIINNLIVNAFKFTAKGKVTFRVDCLEEKENRVKLAFKVKDTGIGIEKSKIPQLFHPFAQEETEYHLRKGGVGLGLSIVKKLVDLMGGNISVSSEKNQGSEFVVIVDFDLVEKKPEVPEKDPSFDTLKGKRVLLAEDFSINQRMVTSFLKPYQVEVTLVENGKEALEAFRKEKFDLVLMDIQMPIMDGVEATKRIRAYEREEKLPSTPIIALTAYALKGDREKFMGKGMDAYLSKPYRGHELLGIIKEQLEVGESRRNLLKYLNNNREKVDDHRVGEQRERDPKNLEEIRRHIRELTKATEMLDEEEMEARGQALRDFGKAKGMEFVGDWAFKFLLAVRRKDFVKGEALLKELRKRWEEVGHENTNRGR